MADLMRDDIGLGEVAWRFEPVLQLLVEVEVDIDLLVVRAVERAHLREPDAAGRAHAAAEQHELGIAIALAIAREDVPPDVLGVAENHRHEALEIVLACWSADARPADPCCWPGIGKLVVSGRDCGSWISGKFALIAAGRAALQDHARVDAEEEHQAENDEDAENADAAAAAGAAARKPHAAAWEGKAEAAALVAPVLDVLALSFAAPAHGFLTSISGQNRPIFNHCACAARRHKVHPGRGGTLGSQRR